MNAGTDVLALGPPSREVERGAYLEEPPWGHRDPWSIPPGGLYTPGMVVPLEDWTRHERLVGIRSKRQRGVLVTREQAQRIDFQRQSRGWTLKQLAACSGNVNHISEVLSGERRILPKTLARVLRAVGLEP